MYTYEQLLKDISYLNFYGLETGSIGKSEAGFDIPYAFLGSKTGKQIIISGGIHARENMSSLMCIRQAFLLFKRCLPLNGGVYFVPMINIDGCLLMEKGAEFFMEKAEFLLRANGGSGDFSMWKANINAVDLNTNFDACFGQGVCNKTHPSPSDYIGVAPFDQAETRAVRDFTYLVMPDMTISYHCKGQEMYWYFNQAENKNRDEKIAAAVNKILNYKKIDSSLGSAGGYKDWCVEKLKIPSLTIELGNDSLPHPLKEQDIEPDWQVNKYLPRQLLEIL